MAQLTFRIEVCTALSIAVQRLIAFQRNRKVSTLIELRSVSFTGYNGCRGFSTLSL